MNIIIKSLILLVLLWFLAPTWLSHTELIDCSQEKLQHTKRSFPISANLYAGLNSISRDSNEQYLDCGIFRSSHYLFSCESHNNTYRQPTRCCCWCRLITSIEIPQKFLISHVSLQSSDDCLLTSACLPLIATHFILLSMPLLEWHRRSKNCAISICMYAGWATRWSE